MINVCVIVHLKYDCICSSSMLRFAPKSTKEFHQDGAGRMKFHIHAIGEGLLNQSLWSYLTVTNYSCIVNNQTACICRQ